MNRIILRRLPRGGKRAHAISQADADALVANGQARLAHRPYVYEEIPESAEDVDEAKNTDFAFQVEDDAEPDPEKTAPQTYKTRDMSAEANRRGRPRKSPAEPEESGS